MTTIRIQIDEIEIYGTLDDSDTANAVVSVFPFSSSFNTWGDEIYFPIPIELDITNGQEVVLEGDIAYWPPGNALCIFYGQTPASRDGEIRAASEVSVIGSIQGDIQVLKSVNKRATINIELS
ncbi:MAG: hypothetical protein CL886_02225 [Dehalococcoidia bacterium]|nr:hypothetical protein [Dehalococcoidia bacterium]|tara:strand:- start:9458 stop:9826 length:369 start_codon:yes stop_codon:yes gene_type:complete